MNFYKNGKFVQAISARNEHFGNDNIKIYFPKQITTIDSKEDQNQIRIFKQIKEDSCRKQWGEMTFTFGFN